MRRAILAIVVVGALAADLLASSAAGATGQRCSTSGLPSATRSVTARGSSCATARRVVRLWFGKLKAPHTTCSWVDGSNKPGVCTIRIWRCSSYHTVNGSTYPVTCKSHAGRREIHFVNMV